MVKFVVICILVWHGICTFSSHAEQFSTDTSIPNLPAIVLSSINDTDMQIEPRVVYNYNAGHRIIHVNVSLFETSGSRGDLNNTLYTPRKDYVVTNGIGAHKVHRRKLTWGEARQTCIDEGGHLAVIRSEAEEQMLLQMMSNLSVQFAWVGYHNQFDGKTWISVFDEQLEGGGGCWSKKFLRDSNSHCARLVADGGGLDDYDCSNVIQFVCKISII